MKVDIADLRRHVNDFTTPFNYELNEALNELEELRRYRNDVRTTETENLRLTQALARTERHLVSLINADNAMRDELNERDETVSFKKWFRKLHLETIESITFTLRKKED